jgi:hypothetical protein
VTLAEGYERRWDITSEEGHQGVLFAQWAKEAITSGASVEVKTDLESWRTGNVYIEFECWVSGRWEHSGIDERHTQSVLWAHLVVGPMVLYAPTEYVRWVALKYGKPRECPRGSNPTRGRVMPIPQFMAALVSVAASRVAAVPDAPKLNRAEPFGRASDGSLFAPFGLNKDGGVRLRPGGRRAKQRAPGA